MKIIKAKRKHISEYKMKFWIVIVVTVFFIYCYQSEKINIKIQFSNELSPVYASIVFLFIFQKYYHFKNDVPDEGNIQLT